MIEKFDTQINESSSDYGSPYFSDLIEAPNPSSKQEMDHLLSALQKSKESWVALGISERIAIL